MAPSSKKEEKDNKEKGKHKSKDFKSEQEAEADYLNSQYDSSRPGFGSDILTLQLFQALLAGVVILFGMVLKRQPKESSNTEDSDKRRGPASGSKPKGSKPSSRAVAGKKGVLSMQKDELKKWAWTEGFIPIVTVSLAVLVVAFVIGGEGYNAALREETNRVETRETNSSFYEELGVARDAPTTEIKKAYKALAKRYHPDRNPNCGENCTNTFAKIAKAYETLSNKKARAAYDERGGVGESKLFSAKSVPIKPEDFDSMVVRSNDYWVIQLYEPQNTHSSSFHPFWESQVEKHGHLFRFGRVDMTDLKDYSWLPFKPHVFPTVFKISRRFGVQLFPITAQHETNQLLTKFILSSFPLIGLPLQNNPASLNSWLQSRTSQPKVLLALPIGDKAGTGSKSLYGPRKVSTNWDELFEFRHAAPEDIRKLSLSAAHKPSQELLDAVPKDGSTLNGALILFGKEPSTTPLATVQIKWPDENDALEGELRTNFADAYIADGAVLHQTNFDLLCSGVADQLRVFCLVLIDPSEGEVDRVREELRVSKQAHAKEIEEFRESGGEVVEGEDAFHVNVVRLLTKTSSALARSTSNCMARGWPLLQSKLNESRSFLVEADTLRVATTQQTSYKNLYQQIGLDENLVWLQKPDERDLKPDEIIFDRLHTLPDCEEGFRHYAQRRFRETPLAVGVPCGLLVIVALECLCQALAQMKLKWAGAAMGVVGVLLLQNPPFIRMLASNWPF